MSLRERTISGVLWSLFAQGGQQVVGFALSLVLARLLVPEDFGLLGMIAVFSGFALLFTDLGLGAALVQREDLRADHLDSAFWLNAGVGFALTLLFLAAAPGVAAVYAEPQLVPLVRALAVTFLLSGSNVVQNALLVREMDFRRIVIIQMTSHVAGGVAGIGLALSGAGVWSLVAQSLASVSTRTVMLWLASPWHPRVHVDRQAMRDLWEFGGNVTGFNVLNYWVRSADDFLIGRFVGAQPLGVYTRAYSIMLLPVNRVAGAVGQVMFPAFSRIQSDLRRSRAIYLQAIGAIALVTFPTMLGLLVVADEFVLGVLGPQWVEVIPILRLFCLVGLTQSIGTTVGWIYQAQGRTDWMFRWGMATSVVTVGAFLAGLPWGAWGVAVAYTIRTYALTYFNFSIPGRLIGVRFSDVVKAVGLVFLLAGTMASVVLTVDAAVQGRVSHVVALLLETTLGVIVYGGLVLLVRPRAFEDVRGILREVRERRQVASVPPVDFGGFTSPEGRAGEPLDGPRWT